MGRTLSLVQKAVFLLIFLTAASVLAGCGYYVSVESGDTLSSIAKKYDLTVNDLLDANPEIKNADKLAVGQKIRIPRDKSLVIAQSEKSGEQGSEQNPGSAPTPGPAKKTKPGKEKPNKSNKETKEVKETATPDTAKKANQDSIAPANSRNPASIQFIWPVSGQIMRGYGKAPDGRDNEGLDISASAGQKVVAAADGVVIVSDDKLKGYGNMVVIQHADKWVTIYAHNRVNLVSKGDKVKQGQAIAEIGDSGRADTPQLHFEIRHGSNPVDPATLLPR